MLIVNFNLSELSISIKGGKYENILVQWCLLWMIILRFLRFEIAIEHELHHHVDGLVPGAHAEQFDDVAVVEPLHHLGLAQEVNFLVHSASRF